MSDRTSNLRGRLAPTLRRGIVPVLAVVGVAMVLGFRGPGPGPAAPLVAAEAFQVVEGFTHSDHETVTCETCHTGADGHGSLSVRTVQDCRVCHHREPLSRSCADCHRASEGPTTSFQATRAVQFSVGTEDRGRALVFPHGAHNDVDCVRCHTQGLALAVPAGLDCQSCHEDHHTPESACASCHVAPPVAAHPPSEAHVTCSGASCHQRFPFQRVERTRAFCLGCHQNMTEHEAPRACAECHALPAPRPVGGVGAE